MIPWIGSAAIAFAVSRISSRVSPGSPTMMWTQIRMGPPAGAPDGVEEGCRVMAPVDRPQRPVVDRLKAELQPDVIPLRIRTDQRKRLIGDAVRPRPDGKTDHVLLGERLVVERPQLLHRGVGVREGLEIGDEFLRLRAIAVEGLSPADLLADRGQRACPPKRRSPPVAIDASPRGDASVAVRAGEPGVDRELVDPAAEAVDPVSF